MDYQRNKGQHYRHTNQPERLLVLPGLDTRKDGQRQRLSPPRYVAGYDDSRTELADGTDEAEQKSGEDTSVGQRHRDRQGDPQDTSTQGSRSHFQPFVHSTHRHHDRPNHQRKRDHGGSQRSGYPREHQV